MMHPPSIHDMCKCLGLMRRLMSDSGRGLQAYILESLEHPRPASRAHSADPGAA